MRLLTTTLLCTLLMACGSEQSLTPEDQVKQTLAAIEQAVEDRTMSGVMEYVADDYKDHQGNDKQGMKRLMQLHFIRNQNIKIFSRINSLDVMGSSAAVELSAFMAAQGIGDAQPDWGQNNWPKADTHQFSIVLSETNGQWLVSSVSWR